MPPRDKLGQAVAGFILDQLQQQAELRHLNRVRVDIDAANMRLQDAPLFVEREPPLAGAGLVDRVAHMRRPAIGQVPAETMVHEELIDAEQENSRATADVCHGESRQVRRALSFECRHQRARNDGIDNVAWSGNDAAAFAHLGLANNGNRAVGNRDFFSEELLVNLTQDLGFNDREGVRGSTPT